MKFSSETLSLLKNFASINTNIVFKQGDNIATISNAKNIFAKATIKESIPNEFAIYDLNSLLALLTLMENQNIEFGEKSLTISKDNGKFEYFYSALNVIVAAPDKTIEVDEYFKFTMASEDVNMIMKAAAITSAPTISVISSDGKVMLVVGDKKNDTSNTYRKVIGSSDNSFECHMAVENFKIIPDSYTVTVSQKKLLHFKNNSKSLEYFIAMEPDSNV